MVTVNVGRETNIPVNLMHGRSEVNLALMGLRLRKYTELRDFAGGAIAHRG